MDQGRIFLEWEGSVQLNSKGMNYIGNISVSGMRSFPFGDDHILFRRSKTFANNASGSANEDSMRDLICVVKE